MMFKCAALFLFLLQFHLNNTKSICFNENLASFNCNCSVLYLTDELCSNGIIDLACSFKNTSSQFNYIEKVWNIVNGMKGFFWSQFQFENVKQLNSLSMFDVRMFSLDSNVIPVKFKNIHTIKASAFSSFLDNYLFDIQIDSQKVVIEEQAFGLIKAKLVKFMNNDYLSLNTSMFQDSTIETIQIVNSNLIGFINDSISEKIQNLIVDTCFVDTLMSSSANINGFQQIINIQIKNSGLTSLKTNLFAECCTHLKELRLNNNLLESIQLSSLNGLNSLEFLDLSRNPIKFIDSRAFLSFEHSLRSLNLNQIRMTLLEESLFHNLTSLEEISLAQSFITNLWPISNQIKYLDLANSKLVTSATDLNTVLDSVNQTTNGRLFYLNLNGNYLDEKKFFLSYNKYLWYNLETTFVHLNEDHECSCAMFYLYINMSRFNFPIKIGQSESIMVIHKYLNLTGNQLLNKTLWEQSVLPLMPKCYRKLWLDTFSLEKINEAINECGFNRSTTVSPTLISSTRHQKLITKNILIYSKYTIPVIGSVFLLTFVILILLVLKAKYDHKHRFLRIFNNNFDHLNKGPKELSNLNSRFSFDPRHITQQ